ncbi:unnamed protein product [Arctogadus glacialis]
MSLSDWSQVTVLDSMPQPTFHGEPIQGTSAHHVYSSSPNSLHHNQPQRIFNSPTPLDPNPPLWCSQPQRWPHWGEQWGRYGGRVLLQGSLKECGGPKGQGREVTHFRAMGLKMKRPAQLLVVAHKEEYYGMEGSRRQGVTAGCHGDG